MSEGNGNISYMDTMPMMVQPELSAALPLHPLEDGRLGLYAWQEEAFEAWVRSDHQGIVEAVTGAGKTRLGLAAISAAIREGRQVLLLVPTIELLHQWFSEVRTLLPWVRVGRLGDQHRDDFTYHQLIVSTVQSAVRTMQRGALNPLSGHGSRLLVADEVHRLAGEQFSRVLDETYPWRLGLSATYERPDEKHLEHLDPYFGGVVFRLWYERAREDNLIAPFDIALIGVRLEPREYSEYQELSERISKCHRSLQGYMPNGAMSAAQFLATVAGWAAEEALSARTMLARKYMRAVSSRQRLLSQTHAKLTNLELLTPALANARSSLIFSLTQQGAEDAAKVVARGGISATAVYSEMGSAQRKQHMHAFRQGSMPVLAAPRVLDEGVDVPEAELGIVLAANRSKRQLVQRLGRVIRRKKDGRAGKLAYFYAKETIEDPEISGDEHLNQVLPYARDLGWFDLPSDLTEVLAFLDNPAPDALAPEPTPGRHQKRQPALRVRPLVDLQVKSGAKPGNRGDAESNEGPSKKNRDRRVSRDASGPGDSSAGEDEVEEIEIWDGEIPEQLRGVATLGKDSTHLYLKQISQFKLLTAEEEVLLGREIEVGLLAQEQLDAQNYRLRRGRRDLEWLVKRGRHAHTRFLCANLRLVVSIAKKYTAGARTLDLLDLIQEGNLGLERAIQKWDFRKGLKFSTYGIWWIQQSITRATADTSRTIRLPVHKVEELKKAQSLKKYAERHADENTALALVATQLQMTVRDLTALLELDEPPLNIDRRVWLLEPGHIQEVSFGDTIIDDHDEGVDHALLVEDLRLGVDDVLRNLTSREEEVLRKRHGLPFYLTKEAPREPMTLDAIGEELGVTRERVRQIEKQAREKLIQLANNQGTQLRDLI